MKEAGFTDIEVRQAQLGYHLKDFNDWWEIVWNSGFRAMVEQLADDKRASFQQRHLARIGELAGEDGIWFDVDTLFTLGKVPA